MVAIVADVQIKLSPCPFCGGLDLHVETDSEPSSFQVYCDNPGCEAEGPHGSTEESAAAAWNRRPPP